MTTPLSNLGVTYKEAVDCVREFGADPSGNTDSTAAIQAAIDYAFTLGNNGIRPIRLPRGNYVTSLPIFVDPPRNLRGLNGGSGPWQNNQTYSQNAVVSQGGVSYISLQNNNIGNTPGSSPTWWQAFNWNSGTAYTAGMISSFDGIPWVCVTPNTNQQPFLPGKISGASYNTGQVAEYANQYWQALQNGASWSTLLYGHFNSAFWENVPIYWLPTTVLPSDFAFSFTFEGEDGQDTGESQVGTFIKPTFNHVPCVNLGTGQGDTARCFQVIGPINVLNDGYCQHIGQPSGGVAVAINGGGGGSSRTIVDRIGAYNFYAAFKTGVNQDSLGDSNTWWKCNVNNAGFGIWIGATQNFINSAYECNLNAVNAVFSAVGDGINCVGGNYSAVLGSPQGAAYTLTSQTATNFTQGGNYTNWNGIQLVATVTNPDSFLAAGVFNFFAVKTSDFGVVPFSVVSFNQSTNVITLRTPAWWDVINHGQGAGGVTGSGVLTEVQAATTLYAATVVQTFVGTGIIASAIHIEQDSNNPTALITAGEGFGGNWPNKLEGIHFNTDATLSSLGPAHTGSLSLNACYYGQLLTPFFAPNSTDTRVTDSYFGQSNNSDPLLISPTNGTNTSRLIVENCKNTVIANYGTIPTLTIGSPFAVSPQNFYVGGTGEFDRPLTPIGLNPSTWLNSIDGAQRIQGDGIAPYWGARPAPYAMPTINSAELSLYSNLPALNSGNPYPYVLLWGGQTYQVYDNQNLGNKATFNSLVRSNHIGYTYGQNLTTTNLPSLSWSYKAGSNVMYIQNATGYLWPGLVLVVPDPLGNPDQLFIILFVAQQDGYVVLYNMTIGGNPLPGTVGTVYTGTTIKQQPFQITTFGSPVAQTFETPPAPLTGVSNVLSAYSLRLLNTAYAGKAVNVRRSSDNTTQDIGFVLGQFDQLSFSNFVGAGTGFVTKWYDQSGNGNDIAQATSANQPQITLNAQNGRPVVTFNGNQTLTGTWGAGPTTVFVAETVSRAAVNNAHYAFPFWQLNNAGVSNFAFLNDANFGWYKASAPGGEPFVNGTVRGTFYQSSVALSSTAETLTVAAQSDTVNGGTTYSGLVDFTMGLAPNSDAGSQPLIGDIAEFFMIAADYSGGNDRPLVDNQRLYYQC